MALESYTHTVTLTLTGVSTGRAVGLPAMGVMALSFWLTEELKEPPRF